MTTQQNESAWSDFNEKYVFESRHWVGAKKYRAFFVELDEISSPWKEDIVAKLNAVFTDNGGRAPEDTKDYYGEIEGGDEDVITYHIARRTPEAMAEMARDKTLQHEGAWNDFNSGFLFKTIHFSGPFKGGDVYMELDEIADIKGPWAGVLVAKLNRLFAANKGKAPDQIDAYTNIEAGDGDFMAFDVAPRTPEALLGMMKRRAYEHERLQAA